MLKNHVLQVEAVAREGAAGVAGMGAGGLRSTSTELHPSSLLLFIILQALAKAGLLTSSCQCMAEHAALDLLSSIYTQEHATLSPLWPKCCYSPLHLRLCSMFEVEQSRQETDRLRKCVSTHGKCQCMHIMHIPLATCHYHCWSLKAEVSHKLVSQPPDTDHIFMLSRFRAELSITVVQYASSYAILHHVYQALQLSTCQYMTL